MDWECRACGRVHDRDPGTCACGSGDLRPRDGEPSRLERARQVLLEPDATGTDLTAAGPYVSLAFRLIAAVAALIVVLAILTWLL